MQLYRFFICAVFFGLLAGATYSQTDPTVQINKDPPAISCSSSGPVLCYDGTETALTPLVESFNNPQDFQFDPSDPNALLTNFYFAFKDVPPLTELTCASNIWAACPNIIPANGGQVEWHFSGGSPGYLVSGEGGIVTLSPEPTSIVLFGTGLMLVLIAIKRRPYARPEFI